jgi:hypothetical protein
VKSAPGQKGRAPADGSLTPDSLSNGDGRSGIFTGEHVLESESAYFHSEDEIARSPQGSPAGRAASASPSQDFADVFAKNTEADIDTQRYNNQFVSMPFTYMPPTLVLIVAYFMMIMNFIFLAIEVLMNQLGVPLTQMMMWTQSGDLTLQATR